MNSGGAATSSLPGPRVELWLLPPDQHQLAEHCRTGLGLLSKLDLTRIDRCTNAKVARRFLLGRVLMRRALATHLDVDPASLVIMPGPLGKPMLLDPVRPSLVFNLSYGRSCPAFALAKGSGLGVDVEPIDRTAPMGRIASTFYSARERRWLRQRGDDAATEALQLWTLKEAVAKAVGGTVWEAVRAVQLELGASHIAWLAPPPEGDEACWSLVLGRLWRDHWLALALKSPTAPMRNLTVSCRILDGGDHGETAPFEPISTSFAGDV